MGLFEIVQRAETKIHRCLPPIEVDAFQIRISLLHDNIQVEVTTLRIVLDSATPISDYSKDIISEIRKFTETFIPLIFVCYLRRCLKLSTQTSMVDPKLGYGRSGVYVCRKRRCSNVCMSRRPSAITST